MKIRCSNFKNTVYSILSVIMLILPAIPSSYAAPIKLYWTDSDAGKIQSAIADGTGLKDVLTGLTAPEAIAVDSPSEKMYWTSEGPVTIRRSNLDGSNVEGLRTGGRPQGIAIDRLNGKMYWTEPDLLQIRRANLNGSEEEIIVDLGNEFPGQFISPFGIAMDLENNRMYWTNEGDINIQRANLDGSGIENLVNGLSFPEAIALDLVNRKMYWTDEADARIERANLDGTGREILIEGGSAEGIALDIDAGMMYWADNGGSIWKAELDGNNATGIVMGLESPGGIAAVPPPEVQFAVDFSANPTWGPAPLTVSFTDQSTGSITSWEWDFGDGSTSTMQNPSHTYTDLGTLTVSLTVTGPVDSGTNTKVDYIKVRSPGKAMPWIPLLLTDD